MCSTRFVVGRDRWARRVCGRPGGPSLPLALYCGRGVASDVRWIQQASELIAAKGHRKSSLLRAPSVRNPTE